MKKGQRRKRKRNRELQKRIKKIIARFRHSSEKISGGDPMVFVITAQTKKDSQAAHTDFTRSVYMESDTQPDNQTVLEKWKQKYGDDVDESTVPLKFNSRFSFSALTHRVAIKVSHSTAVSKASDCSHSVIGSFKFSVGLCIRSHPHAAREGISSINPQFSFSNRRFSSSRLKEFCCSLFT